MFFYFLFWNSFRFTEKLQREYRVPVCPLPRFPLMLTTYITMINSQKQEMNTGTWFLTEVYTLLKLHQFFHWCPFSASGSDPGPPVALFFYLFGPLNLWGFVGLSLSFMILTFWKSICYFICRFSIWDTSDAFLQLHRGYRFSVRSQKWCLLWASYLGIHDIGMSYCDDVNSAHFVEMMFAGFLH